MATASSKRDEAINHAKLAKEKYEKAIIAEANCRKAATKVNTTIALQYLAQATEYLNKCKAEMESAEKWSQFAQTTYNNKSNNEALVKTKVAELAGYAEQARVLAAKYTDATSKSNINDQTTLTAANTKLTEIKTNNTNCANLVTKAVAALKAANDAKTAANTTQANNWLNGTGLSYTYSGSSQSKTASAWKSLVDTHKTTCNTWQTTAQTTYNNINNAINSLTLKVNDAKNMRNKIYEFYTYLNNKSSSSLDLVTKNLSNMNACIIYFYKNKKEYYNDPLDFKKNNLDLLNNKIATNILDYNTKYNDFKTYLDDIDRNNNSIKSFNKNEADSLLYELTRVQHITAENVETLTKYFCYKYLYHGTWVSVYSVPTVKVNSNGSIADRDTIEKLINCTIKTIYNADDLVMNFIKDYSSTLDTIYIKITGANGLKSYITFYPYSGYYMFYSSYNHSGDTFDSSEGTYAAIYTFKFEFYK